MARYEFTTVVETESEVETAEEADMLADQIAWGIGCLDEYDEIDLNGDPTNWPTVTASTTTSKPV